jgi:hypothetical protein
MNEAKLYPDDPRLTAYALGELEGDERAAVELALKTDAAARAAVDEIRDTARQLEAALAAEPMPTVKLIAATPAQRAAIVPGRDPRKLDGGPLPLQNLIRFPQACFLVAGLAAACFAVMLTLHESEVGRLEEPINAVKLEEIMKATAESHARKADADAAIVKPSSYTEVTFPVAAIPVGRVELQAKTQEIAEADKKVVLAEAMAPKQNVDAAAPVSRAVVAEKNQSPPQAVAADKTAMLGAAVASNQPAKEETIQISEFEVSAAPVHGYDASETMTGTRVNTAITDLPFADSDFLSVAQNPLSTFGLDAGMASYANVRRFLQAGGRPPADVVRIEELVNYFPYAYAAPRDHAPLAATLEVAAAPWAPTHRLVRIGLKAREVPAGGMRVTVAKDVKVQVAFNPAQVESYRLIGYNGSPLKNKDFSKNVIPPAGDLAAGHVVTALYEIVPVGVELPGGDALKYGKVESQESRVVGASSKELLIVTVRYTPPEGGASQQLEFPLMDHGAAFAEASMDFKFAAAVAGFGMILRDSPDKGSATLAEVEQWAGQGLGSDAGGYRAEFVGLVHQAEKLKE